MKQTLDIEPFRDWLTRRIERVGRQEWLNMTGINDRSLVRVMRENKSTNIATVDEWVSRDGTAHIIDLYPELYE